MLDDFHAIIYSQLKREQSNNTITDIIIEGVFIVLFYQCNIIYY